MPATAQQTETAPPPLRRTVMEPVREIIRDPARGEVVTLALFLGTLFFAVTAAVGYVRTRRELLEGRQAADEMIAEAKSRADRADSLLEAERAAIVSWDSAEAEPDVRLPAEPVPGLPGKRSEVLAFGKWLGPRAAVEVERAVERLRGRGASFNLTARARDGGHVEVDGRAVGGRAVLRLRRLIGQSAELAEFRDRYLAIDAELRAFRQALQTLPLPVWTRDTDGTLVFANAACLAAASAPTLEALAQGRAHAFAAPLEQIAAQRRERGHGETRLAAGKEGQRRVYRLHEANFDGGAIGWAVDVTEVEAARSLRERAAEAHDSALEKVATAIAVFDAERRLSYHNAAFRELWPLPESFLAERPGLGELLDRLRAARRLPEQADYRRWHRAMVEGPADAAEEEKQGIWHLPDGQILRVLRSANGDGGVTFLFEDLTRTLDLESRFVALTHVQRETLDSLVEAIAVFGSDGRLKLHNPALAEMWGLDPAALEGEPHVDEVARWARSLHPSDEDWEELTAAVTGLADQRRPAALRMERTDGRVLDLRTAPLPEGSTLAVFTDMTDTARVERVLRDRNEALVAASRVKNEFVHKVSYELRAPLTNIIGFTQLMNDPATGTLSERQRDYADHILSSSSALLAIINDILDLATIDAGVLELELGAVAPRRAAEAAAAGLADRLNEAGVGLELDVPEDLGTFTADEKRVRQVLFNLLSNAISFSERGQTVRLSCRRDGDAMAFVAEDEGPGMPEEVRRLVFERFESHSLGTDHRGAGLGLSLVKSLVELHGGRVELDTAPGRGTRVTCVFPRVPPVRANGGAPEVTPLRAPRDKAPDEAGETPAAAGRHDTF